MANVTGTVILTHSITGTIPNYTDTGSVAVTWSTWTGLWSDKTNNWSTYT